MNAMRRREAARHINAVGVNRYSVFTDQPPHLPRMERLNRRRLGMAQAVQFERHII